MSINSRKKFAELVYFFNNMLFFHPILSFNSNLLHLFELSLIPVIKKGGIDKNEKLMYN